VRYQKEDGGKGWTFILKTQCGEDSLVTFAFTRNYWLKGEKEKQVSIYNSLDLEGLRTGPESKFNFITVPVSKPLFLPKQKVRGKQGDGKKASSLTNNVDARPQVGV